MSDTTVTYTLSATDIDAVIGSFSENDATIAKRIFTVGGLCQEHGVTPKDVFAQVNAHRDLTAGTPDAPRTIKGWSASSIANAKTAFDLYLLTGITLKYGNKSDRDLLAGLVEDVRRLHGAKTVKTTIVDATSQFTETIAPSERYDAVVSILRALKGIPAEDNTKDPKTPEERFLSALASAVKLSESVELSIDQAEAAQSLINELAALALTDAE